MTKPFFVLTKLICYPTYLLKKIVNRLDKTLYEAFAMDHKGPIWTLFGWLVLYSIVSALLTPYVILRYPMPFSMDFLVVSGFYGLILWIMLLYHFTPALLKWALNKLK